MGGLHGQEEDRQGRTSRLLTFAEWLSELHARKYTGPVVVQFGEGVPNEVEMPRPPDRIRLTRMKAGA
jgi:hypothetical protein